MEGAWAQLIMQICSVRELMLASLGVDAKKRKVFQVCLQHDSSSLFVSCCIVCQTLWLPHVGVVRMSNGLERWTCGGMDVYQMV